MSLTAIETFVRTVSSAWSAGEARRIATCRVALAALARSDSSEPWLRTLLEDRPECRELFHSRDHGFFLLADGERKGLYRPPHDHGRAFVVYAVQSGELEVGTYANEALPGARPILGRSARRILRPGEARAYRQGDIHDTRCLSDHALLLRFTERDLRREEQVDAMVTRFVSGSDGRWTTRS